MKGSPVKLGVVVVLALVGIITLATAFDSGTPTVPTGEAVVPTPPGTTKAPKPPKTAPDVVEGVHVGVYNGTSTTGEAAIVAAKLEREGYVVDETGNTVDPMPKTIVYFVKPPDEAAATALANAQFTGATVEQAPVGVTVQDAAGNEVSPAKAARLLVFVGNDFLSK